MTRQEVRLEILRLTYRHDRSPEDVITAAKIFEKYLAEDLGEPVKETPERDLAQRKPGRPPKAGNASSL